SPFLERVLALAPSARAIFASHGVLACDHFLGLELMGERLSASALARALAARPPNCRTLEWMTHPGYAVVPPPPPTKSTTASNSSSSSSSSDDNENTVL